MNHSILLTIVVILFSFHSYSQEEKSNSVKLIEINSEIKFNWDNSTSKIVEDCRVPQKEDHELSKEKKLKLEV